MQTFRRQMMDKFSQDERLEQMSDIKRRERQAAHRKEIDRIVVERRETGGSVKI